MELSMTPVPHGNFTPSLIRSPANGLLRCYGADIAPEGEPVTLIAEDSVAPNSDPDARILVTGSGSAYTFDATSSADPDGVVHDYLWDFGDGTPLTPGSVVTHTFDPGEYKVVLVATDNHGGKGFATTTGVIAIPDVTPGDGATVISRSYTQLTANLDVARGDVQVGSDFECTGSVHIAGSLVATGNAHLT